MKNQPEKPKCLSLLELTLRSAIDNLDDIGDVGHTDEHSLRIILSHCTAEQLMRIEENTTGRDLSSITGDLWLKWYERSFGEDNARTVMKRLKKCGKSFKWKDLYKAKLSERVEIQKKCQDRVKELYKEHSDQKASRSLQQIDLMPPGSRKRSLGSGGGGRSFNGGKSSSTSSNGRGRLMKKARLEFAASRATTHRKPVAPPSRPSSRR